MQIQRIKKLSSILSILAALMLGYSNCSQPNISENTLQTDLGSKTQTRLTLSPANQTVNWGTNVQFSVLGGAPPYLFKVLSGAGAIDYYDGKYVAPSFDRATVIQVIDAAGAVAQTNVITSFRASSSLTLTLSSESIHPGDNVTLTAGGGVAPYTYFLVSGVGSVTDNMYNASSFGAGVIGVRDSRGVQGTFGITVEPNLTVVAHLIYRHYHSAAAMFLYDKSGSVPDWGLQTSFKVLSLSTYLNTFPLSRCYINSAQGRYLTTGSCGSYTNEGLLGYVYGYVAQNTKPLYNCFKSRTGRYLISTSSQECLDNGFSVLGVLGHVPL